MEDSLPQLSGNVKQNSTLIIFYAALPTEVSSGRGGEEGLSVLSSPTKGGYPSLHLTQRGFHLPLVRGGGNFSLKSRGLVLSWSHRGGEEGLSVLSLPTKGGYPPLHLTQRKRLRWFHLSSVRGGEK